MIVLGIDPSTKSLGLAKIHYDTGEIVRVAGFAIGKKGDPHDLRLRLVHSLVKEWAYDAEVIDVWLSHRDGLTTRRLSEAAGVIKVAARFIAEELNITEIKNHATGKGNATKEQMSEAAYDRWPDLADHLTDTPEDQDEHAIDALWIADLGRTISHRLFKEELANEQ